MSARRDFLYELLPEFIRYSDYYQGQPLRALASVLEVEVDYLEDNLEALYDSWFIETCAEWLVPYIGDLVGVRGLAKPKAMVATQRTRVANTLAYRRRKGTTSVLARAAADVTGWAAVPLEYRGLLGMTQHLEHLRPGAGALVDVRDGEVRLDGPTRTAATTADLKSPGGGPEDPDPASQGVANLPRVGLFFWRLDSCPIYFSTLRPVEPAGRPPGDRTACFTVHPFGIDMPLFNFVRTAPGTVTGRDERELPLPLARKPLAEELDARRRGAPAASEYFVYPQAIHLRLRPPVSPDGDQLEPVTYPRDRLVVCDLTHWFSPRWVTPDRGAVEGDAAELLIDPVLGRVTRPAGPPAGEITFFGCYGFSAPVGGGPYDRSDSLEAPGASTWEAVVFREASGDGTLDDHGHLEARSLTVALGLWAEESERRERERREREGQRPGTPAPPGTTSDRVPDGRILIADSALLDRRPVSRFEVVLAAGQWLSIEADHQRCPGVIDDLVVTGAPDAVLTLNGLWIDGRVVVRGPCDLHLRHCTVRPGSARAAGAAVPPRPSVVVEGTGEGVTLTVTDSLVGPLRLPATATGLVAEDSVVDGGPLAAIAAPDGGPGPAAVLRQVTVFGAVRLSQLPSAVNSLFTSPLTVEQVRYGEVRTSYLAPGSRTPRRVRCQPVTEAAATDRAAAEPAPAAARRPVRPRFTSTAYGHPGYAQLARDCPPEIARGAEDGSEMGVFHQLYQPQREADLGGVVSEYAPWGVELRIAYET